MYDNGVSLFYLSGLSIESYDEVRKRYNHDKFHCSASYSGNVTHMSFGDCFWI